MDGCKYFLPLDLEDILPGDYHVHPLPEKSALNMRDMFGGDLKNTNKNFENPPVKANDWNRRLNRLRVMLTNQENYRQPPTPLALTEAKRKVAFRKFDHHFDFNQETLESRAHFALLSRRGIGDSHDTNEDRSVLIDPYPALSSTHQSKTQEVLPIHSNFFQGIFDGHSGPDMAQFISTTLPTVLLEQLSKLKAKFNKTYSEDQIRQAFKSAFTEAHRLGRAFVHDNSGCTATVVARLQQHLVFANAGDSLSFLLRVDTRTTRGDVVLSTKPHKPDDPIERLRIERAGCVVVDPDPINDPTARVTEFGAGTGGQALAMSRSLGDYDLEHCGITANPTVTIVNLNEYTQKDTVLVAVSVSDGMLDYVSLNEIAQRLSPAFSDKNANVVSRASPLVLACEELIWTASKRWHANNVLDIYRDDISLVARRVK